MPEIEEETITTQIVESRSFRGFFIWLAIVGGIAVLVPVLWGLWLVHQYLPILGIIWLGALSLIPILGIIWGIVVLLGYATKDRYQSLSQYGGYSRDLLGRERTYAPMISAPTKIHTRANKVEISLAVPSLFDLIEEGMIAPGNTEMVMGYDKAALAKGALEQIVGPWPGTHAVAGKGRSGKTRRVIATIAQALISGAHVIICDPHYSKADSLARSLEPLSRYLTIARGEEEIVAAARDFLSEMESRVDDASRTCTPWLFVADEWSRLMDENNTKMPEGGRDLLIDIAKNCSIQYAGYQGYCCLIGQIWTQEACGGTEIRRSLQSVFVHQLSAEYASFFFRAAKWKNKAEELKRRECVYRDTDGQVREVVTLGVPDDTATRVAAYLTSIGFAEIEAPGREQAIEAPGREHLLYSPQYAMTAIPETSGFKDETEIFTQAENRSFTPAPSDLRSTTAHEITRFSSREEKKAEIHRLRSLNFKQGEIMQTIWKVKPGATQEYKEARSEYQNILEEIARGA